MKKIFLSLTLLLYISCATIPNQSKVAYINNQRLELLEAATKGDSQAQYELGNSYCCGSNGFYSTKEAIKWWCKASRQGHIGAKEKITKNSGQCEEQNNFNR